MIMVLTMGVMDGARRCSAYWPRAQGGAAGYLPRRSGARSLEDASLWHSGGAEVSPHGLLGPYVVVVGMRMTRLQVGAVDG